MKSGISRRSVDAVSSLRFSLVRLIVLGFVRIEIVHTAVGPFWYVLIG